MMFLSLGMGATVGSQAAIVGLLLASAIFDSHNRTAILAVGLAALAIPVVIIAIEIVRSYTIYRAGSSKHVAVALSDFILVEAGCVLGGIVVCFGGQFGMMLAFLLWY
jgi:hypothetical protein